MLLKKNLEDIWHSLKIVVCIVGDEYQKNKFTRRDYCEQGGIDLCFNSRDHMFSSSGLRREV